VSRKANFKIHLCFKKIPVCAGIFFLFLQPLAYFVITGVPAGAGCGAVGKVWAFPAAVLGADGVPTGAEGVPIGAPVEPLGAAGAPAEADGAGMPR
jgi:hypothetical protein